MTSDGPFSNVLLLCKPHHTYVDTIAPHRFAPEQLERWKTQREAGMEGQLSRLNGVDEAQMARLLTQAVQQGQERVETALAQLEQTNAQGADLLRGLLDELTGLRRTQRLVADPDTARILLRAANPSPTAPPPLIRPESPPSADADGDGGEADPAEGGGTRERIAELLVQARADGLTLTGPKAAAATGVSVRRAQQLLAELRAQEPNGLPEEESASGDRDNEGGDLPHGVTVLGGREASCAGSALTGAPVRSAGLAAPRRGRRGHPRPPARLGDHPERAAPPVCHAPELAAVPEPAPTGAGPCCGVRDRRPHGRTAPTCPVRRPQRAAGGRGDTHAHGPQRTGSAAAGLPRRLGCRRRWRSRPHVVAGEHLGQTRRAAEVQRQALRLYPDDEAGIDPALIRLDQATCMAHDHAVGDACQLAQAAVLALPADQRAPIVLARARALLTSLPPDTRTLGPVRQLHETVALEPATA